MLVPALILAISASVAPGAIDPLLNRNSVTVAMQSTKAATDPFGAQPVMSVIVAKDTSGIAKNPLTHR